MRIFGAIDPDSSLAATARTLGISPATVSRAVTLLENEAGEVLLERSTRHLSFTSKGREHQSAYAEIVARLDSLARREPEGALSGNVAITAPELFGRLVVVPALHSLRLANPELRIRLLLQNRLSDLIGEGIDLAIRIAKAPDANLQLIKVGQVRRVTCASPDYIERAGEPRSPDELKNHLCIGLNGAGFDEQWHFNYNGRPRSQRIQCSMTTNNAAASICIAEMGGGIIQALSYQVTSQLEHGLLQPVLGKYAAPPLDVQIVHRHNPPNPRSVRRVAEHLGKSMAI
ncbi:LysR family transcriptional regulator [Qipengyuania sp. 6D47A]|uniref:LysR family transcriptional regulator n=2 Tax=Qipengyuania qiaonensis TaxID=2867240 RepID=A0ABS7JAL2_9SPHN|nr:LysR family transcriptional regulator [Qipengyuania qiaonensis]